MSRTLVLIIVAAALVAAPLRATGTDEPEYVEVTEAEAAPKGVLTPPPSPEVRQRFAGKTVTVACEIYLAPDGHVTKVETAPSSPPLDEPGIKRLMEQKFAALQRYVRFAVEFTYTLAPAGYKPPPVHMPPMMRMSGDYPRLPDEVKRRNVGKQLAGVYIVSIDRDGHVTAVEPKVSIPGADAAIVATVKAWRYNAGGVPVRRAERFVFDIVEPRFR